MSIISLSSEALSRFILSTPSNKYGCAQHFLRSVTTDNRPRRAWSFFLSKTTQLVTAYAHRSTCHKKMEVFGQNGFVHLPLCLCHLHTHDLLFLRWQVLQDIFLQSSQQMRNQQSMQFLNLVFLREVCILSFKALPAVKLPCVKKVQQCKQLLNVILKRCPGQQRAVMAGKGTQLLRWKISSFVNYKWKCLPWPAWSSFLWVCGLHR